MKLYSVLFEGKQVRQQNHPELTTKKTTIDTVQQHFNHFHLSRIFLGEPTFTFTPRIPPEPYTDKEGNTTEDDFTRRISLAADIEDARDAISDYGGTYYYIYATQIDTGIQSVENNLDSCPKNPPKKYGRKFVLSKWLEKNKPEELQAIKANRGFTYNMAPSILSPETKAEFKGCVPDSNETHEEWSLKPLRMIFVGTIGEAGDVVQLSKAGAAIMGL
jgi:hypothetical protein